MGMLQKVKDDLCNSARRNLKSSNKVVKCIQAWDVIPDISYYVPTVEPGEKHNHLAYIHRWNEVIWTAYYRDGMNISRVAEMFCMKEISAKRRIYETNEIFVRCLHRILN